MLLKKFKRTSIQKINIADQMSATFCIKSRNKQQPSSTWTIESLFNWTNTDAFSPKKFKTQM